MQFALAYCRLLHSHIWEPEIHLACFWMFASFIALALVSLQDVLYLLLFKFESCFEIAVALCGWAYRSSWTLLLFTYNSMWLLFTICARKHCRLFCQHCSIIAIAVTIHGSTLQLLLPITEGHDKFMCKSLGFIALHLGLCRSHCSSFLPSCKIIAMVFHCL